MTPPPSHRPFELYWLPTGTDLYRCHDVAYPAWPGWANPISMRFSPVDADPAPAVLYAGQSKECALRETVFRDLLGGAPVHPNRLANRALTQLQTRRTMRLADFRNTAARKVHAYSEDLGTTIGLWPARCYQESQLWAKDVYEDHAQGAPWEGIAWSSHQEPALVAVMLFTDRLTGNPVTIGVSETITTRHPLIMQGANDLGVILPVGH